MIGQTLAPDGIAPQHAEKPRVLLVEDDRMSQLMIDTMLKQLGYAVETAANGVEAYAMLRENPTRADIVVTDRMMPMMDGITLTRRLKREEATKLMPVILLTGASEAGDIGAGIEAGAFYYLTKPCDAGLLERVLRSAGDAVSRRRRVRSELQAHQLGFANMQMVKFTLRMPEEVEPVVSLLASMATHPESVIQGLADLVGNAIEHGLYRLGQAEKQRLDAEHGVTQELARRAADPQFAGQVEVSAVRKDGGIAYVVKDSGPGFAWRQHIRADPARATAATGRGIARAAIIFDRLSYNEEGNTAFAVHSEQVKERW